MIRQEAKASPLRQGADKRTNNLRERDRPLQPRRTKASGRAVHRGHQAVLVDAAARYRHEGKIKELTVVWLSLTLRLDLFIEL